MQIEREKEKDIAEILLPGESLDVGNLKEFRRDIGPLLASKSRVIFDMSELQFVDSSGMGAILSCLRQINAAGGELKLSGLTKPVRVLFELVRMHRVFEIFNTREEALRAF